MKNPILIILILLDVAVFVFWVFNPVTRILWIAIGLAVVALVYGVGCWIAKKMWSH